MSLNEKLNGAEGRPTHDYIAEMAAELADMARELNDRRLGHLLDLAATFAELPPEKVRSAEGPRPSP